MKRVFVLLFRKIVFFGTESENKEKVFVVTFEDAENTYTTTLSEKIWKKMISENKTDIKDLFIPGSLPKKDKLELEQVHVVGDKKYDWSLLAELISKKITDAEEACNILTEITSLI